MSDDLKERFFLSFSFSPLEKKKRNVTETNFIANELFVKEDPAEKLAKSDSNGEENDDIRGD